MPKPRNATVVDYTVAAVDRALALLEMVADHPGIGLSELARFTGSTKALAFRMACTLEHRGYLLRDPDTRGYTLGYKPLWLGERVQQQQAPLLRMAGPILDELADRSRENVSLLVRDGLQSVCIAIRHSPQPIRLYAELGRPGPLHVGGGPKLLLAFAPPDVQAEVLAGPLDWFTPETITEGPRLSALLTRIRRQGYNVSHGDLDVDAFSVAAPVRDHAGLVVASLSIAGPQTRFNGEVEAVYVRMLLAASGELSTQLGWTEASSRKRVK